MGDLNFPTPADLVNYTSDFQPLVAKIPPERVFEQLAKQDLNSCMIIMLAKCNSRVKLIIIIHNG